MQTTQAMITTQRASTYLQQLCKHFGHKVDVQFDPKSGRITFPFGHCDLSADQHALALTVTATSPADLTKTSRVIGSHLERFAFRENPTIDWQAPPHAPTQL